MGHQQQITSVERMRFFNDGSASARVPPPPRNSDSILAWDTDIKSSRAVASTPPRSRGSKEHCGRPSPILAWNDKQFGRSARADPSSQSRSNRKNVSTADLSWSEEQSRPHNPSDKVEAALPHRGMKNAESNAFDWNVEPTKKQAQDELRSRPQRFLKKKAKEEKTDESRPQGNRGKKGDRLVHEQHQATPTSQRRRHDSDLVKAKPHPRKSPDTTSMASLASDESSRLEFGRHHDRDLTEARPHPTKSLGTKSLSSLTSEEPSQIHLKKSLGTMPLASIASDESSQLEFVGQHDIDPLEANPYLKQQLGTRSLASLASDESSQADGCRSFASGSAILELLPAKCSSYRQDHMELDRRVQGLRSQHSEPGNSRAWSYQRSEAGNSRVSSYANDNNSKKGGSSQATPAHRVFPGGELRPVPGGELRPPTPAKRASTPRRACTDSEASQSVPAFKPMSRSSLAFPDEPVLMHKMDQSCSVASTSVYGSESGASDVWEGASGYASTAA